MKQIPIAFHFDLVCPWCLIGLRHLGTAIAAFRREAPDIEVRIDWCSHVLLPDIPPAGVPYQAFYERRLGSPAAVTARRAQVRAAAAAADFEPAFDRIPLMPNTRAAHRLIDRLRATNPAQVGALIERLFVAFFVDAEDIGDTDTLAAIGAAFGLDAAATRASHADAMQFRQLPPQHGAAINGVPHFVIGHQHLSGAVPPEPLLAALRAAATEATDTATAPA